LRWSEIRVRDRTGCLRVPWPRSARDANRL